MVQYFKYTPVEAADAIDEQGCLKDKHSVRVSMQDAQKVRGTLSDAESRMIEDMSNRGMSDAVQRQVLADMAARKSARFNRPGYRTFSDFSDTAQEAEDNQTVMDVAYDEVEKANAEAWRTLGGPNTQSRGNAFSGQTGSQPGSPCTLNGEAGTLQYNSEGALVCVVSGDHWEENVRTLSTDPGQEAASGSLDQRIRQHDAIMEDVYQAYARRQSNAWRMK